MKLQKWIKQKMCKRRKCPYYNIYSEKCGKCDWNPDGYWVEKKARE